MRYYISLIIVYFFLTKIIVNTDSDVAGTFKSSSIAYIIAVLTLLFIFIIIIKRYRNLAKLPIGFYFLIPLFYYLDALLFSFFSLIPQISIFRAITGVGFVLVAISIGKFLSRFSLKIQIKYFYKTILYLFIWGVVANVFYHFIYKSNISIINLQAGYMALLSIYLSLWHFINYKYDSNNKQFLLFLFFFIITFFLHSFSAFIAFYIGIIYILIFTNQKYLGMILFIVPIVSMSFIINYLNLNPDIWILGKPAAAYLIGSGRFEIYEASFDAFSKLDFLHQFIGIGFMSERDLLSSYKLSWSTDPHNSFIISLLGMGLIGSFTYILFIIFPFFKKKYILKNFDNIIYLKWIVLHITFTVYGITSSSYIGVPSFQLVFFIIFSYIIFKHKLVTEREK